MSEVFVARQPIFDRRLKVAGYELLFRDAGASEAVIVDDVAATATVTLNALTEIGLQRILGPHPGWINASREFLLRGLAATVPPALVGLEILEDQLIDDQLIDAVAELKDQGYRFALDDFQYSPAAERLLALADVVKLDVLQLGRDGLTEQAAHARRYGAAVLAEKIETHADHVYCLNAGCELFQGFFYRRPELISHRRIDANRLSLLQLIAALHEPAIELHELERLIARDVMLSFRLLRYINSAFFGLRCELSSIAQALALLGIERLKRWATLTIFASIDGKPPELTVTALIRARFCEQAGARILAATSSELFTAGLFSVIDALLDTPIEDVVASIPFSREMRDALVARRGEMGSLLDCVTSLETGDLERAQALVPDCGRLHLESIIWANDAADPLFDQIQPAAT